MKIKNNYFISFILTILSMASICINNNTYTVLGDFNEELGGGINGLLWKIQKSLEAFQYTDIMIVFLLFFAFLYLIPLLDKNLFVWSIPFSAIASLFLLLCESYYEDNNWDRVFGNGTAFIFSMIRGIGTTILIFFLFQMINIIIIQLKEKRDDKKNLWKNRFLVWLLIFGAWIPYMIIMFPGNICADATDAIAQILGRKEYSWTASSVIFENTNSIINNHHPVFYTGILWFFIKVGKLIGSYAWGMELYCILQCAFAAAVITYYLDYIKSIGVSKKIYHFTLLFFMFNPLFPLWSTTVVKDTPFTFIVLFCVVILRKVLENPSTKLLTMQNFTLMLGLLLMMLIRHNGAYMLIILLPWSIFLLWKKKKQMKKILFCIAVPLFIFQIIIQGIILPSLKIPKGSMREMLSIPAQQIARTIQEYNDFSDEEEAAILAVFDGKKDTTVEEIADDYNPELADPVKNKFDKYCTATEKKEFFIVWIKGLFRHPDSYIEAFLNLNYSWFGLDSNRDFHYYNGIMEDETGKMLPGVELPTQLATARKAVWRIVDILTKNPLTMWTIEFSIYTWLYVICLFVMFIRKKYTEFFCCGILYLNYLINFVGPVAYTRYAIPMIACAPFLVVLTFSKKKSEV